jgi:hypothetical protein
VAVFWLAVALALFLAVWAYRAPVPPLPRANRVLFAALRFTALSLLILILFQPVVTVASREERKPLLPVLLDVSSSMNLPARAGESDSTTRFQLVHELLTGLLPELERDFEVRLYGFSAETEEIALTEGNPLPAIAARGSATALGPALSDVLARPGRRPAAALLLSDGTTNSGSDPLAAAERLGVPILCVPASYDSAVSDVWVAECLANRNAFLGQETQVSVTVASELKLPTRVTVLLRENDRILSRESVTLPAGPSRTPVEIRFRPDRLGLHRYLIEVEGAPGELTRDNNQRAFAIKIQEERLQVLVLADAITWDFTFIRRALASDRTLSVTALARLDRQGGGYEVLGERRLSGMPSKARDLAPFGAVVLVGVDAGRLPQSAREALVGFARSGGGILAVAGLDDRAFPGFDSPGLGALLPARPGGSSGSARNQLASLSLTDAGLVHPVTSLGEAPSPAAELWRGLPPVRIGSPLEVRMNGEVLVQGEADGGRVPVVVTGRSAGGRVLMVNGTLVWRWGFLLQGMSGSDLVRRRFWGEAVRWLAEGKSGGNLELFADQSVFLGGKRVTLGARLTDDQLRPVDNAEVTVEVVPDGEGEPVPVRLVPGEGRGQYAGEAGFLPGGLYRLRGSAKQGDRRWTAEGDHFLVDQAGIEGTLPAANPDLLRRLAARTNGAFVTPEEAGGSIQSLVERRLAAVQTVELKLWNHAGIFLAFVACVSLEWFLRRRRGLA